jgi:hypothetical protein
VLAQGSVNVSADECKDKSSILRIVANFQLTIGAPAVQAGDPVHMPILSPTLHMALQEYQ